MEPTQERKPIDIRGKVKQGGRVVHFRFVGWEFTQKDHLEELMRNNDPERPQNPDYPRSGTYY